MGGGNKFHYPKWVWTPTGGWWANPRNWRRNTFATAFCLVAFCQFVVIPWSDAHTVEYRTARVVYRDVEEEKK